jgi:HD-like signal output (HDOD) protein
MVAEIISGDPALVAHVLAVVNSAYYSLPKTTPNVKYAVSYLGLGVIQRIVISVGVVNAMGIKEKNELDKFWYHSFLTALTTKYLAKNFFKYLDPEELWTASILHDIASWYILNFSLNITKSSNGIVNKMVVYSRKPKNIINYLPVPT